MEKKLTIKEMVGIAVIAAIIIIMASIPQLGYIKTPFLAFDITFLFVPVLVGATLYGKKGGIIFGLIFGLTSLVVSYVRPGTPFDLTFQNPFVSVLPRVVFPLIYVFLLDLVKKLDTFKLAILVNLLIGAVVLSFVLADSSISYVIASLILFFASIGFTIYAYKHKEKKLEYVIPAVISVIIHGIFVLSMISIFYTQTFVEKFESTNIIYMITMVLVANTFVEAIVTGVILQLIMPTIARSRHE